jgi:hypothetical protein
MNGEVSMLIDRRDNVVAVSNDAVRTVREAAVAATFVGLNPDSVAAQVREMQAQQRSGGAGSPAGDMPSGKAVPMGDATSGAKAKAGARAGAKADAKGAPAAGGRVTRVRTALVFVEGAPGKFSPRLVRLGASDYDYSEVVSGLKEGEKVATLAVQALQAKRDQQNDRFRSMTGSSGMPGSQPSAGGRPGGR